MYAAVSALGERGQMETQTHALRELLQFGRIELVVEFGLAGENDAQGLLLGGLYAGQHAHFLEHAVTQVLRLVDDQQHLAPADVLFHQELVQASPVLPASSC